MLTRKSSFQHKIEYYERISSILKHKNNNINHLSSIRKIVENFDQMFTECNLSLSLWRQYFKLYNELS